MNGNESSELADMLADGDIAPDLATQFNCGEVEKIAAFLRAYGHGDAADRWINHHAEGDDCGDHHCRCGCRT